MLDFLFLVGKLEELGYPGNTAETALINSGGEVDKVERRRHFIIKFSSQCMYVCMGVYSYVPGLHTGFENIGRGEERGGAPVESLSLTCTALTAVRRLYRNIFQVLIINMCHHMHASYDEREEKKKGKTPVSSSKALFRFSSPIGFFQNRHSM